MTINLKRFDKSLRDHSTKLGLVWKLPFLIGHLGRVDPRFGDQAYNKALASNLHQWKTGGNALFQQMQKQGLNEWKQKGFYVHPSGGILLAPSEGIDPKLAQAACRFAWQSIGTLDFVLKDGNLERYMEQAKSIRGTMTESDHQTVEESARQMTEMLFGNMESQPEEQITVN